MEHYGHGEMMLLGQEELMVLVIDVHHQLKYQVLGELEKEV